MLFIQRIRQQDLCYNLISIYIHETFRDFKAKENIPFFYPEKNSKILSETVLFSILIR